MTSLSPVVVTAVALAVAAIEPQPRNVTDVAIETRGQLSTAGTEMTAPTVLVVQHGYSFKGGRTDDAATAVYRRMP